MISGQHAMALLLSCTLFLVGCTWIKPTPEGEQVIQLSDSDPIPSHCKRLGETRSHTRARLGFFVRSKEKIAIEQATLARNEAARMGGNAVAALDSSDDGSRLFGISHCDSKP